MRKFIIDTDAASDDLVACILALRDPGCVVEAITICAGVLDAETANINGRVAVEIANREQPPVYTGMTKPLWRAPMTGENAHGKDGLSDVGLSKTTLPFTAGHAVDKIIELALKYDEETDPLGFLGEIKVKENGYVIVCIDKQTNKLYIPQKR